MKHQALAVGIFILAFVPAGNAQEVTSTDSDPLFGSDELLSVRIVAPFDVIAEERPTEEYVPGQFFFTDSNGAEVEFYVGVRARGNYRRRPDICPFPPLRLNFKKSEVKDTLFDDQDKVKLVTHCTTDSHIYEQAIIAEYLAYRIFNQITDISYRVRLLQVEYVTAGGGETFEGYGVLIEHRDNLAERIGSEPLTLENTPVESLDLEHLNQTSVFHYLIGNTDFSPISGAAGNECCHNHTLFGNEGEPYHSIPYDFDMSGIVGAVYASPNPKLRLDSVQERLYRGRCVNNELLPTTMETYVAKREQIESLVREQVELSSKKRREMLSYIDMFYKTLSSERRINRNLASKCK